MKKRLKIINLLLALVLVGILAAVGYQLSQSSKPPVPEGKSVDTQTATPTEKQEVAGWNQYDQAVQENLFDKTRAPYEPPPPPTPPPPKPKPVVVVPPPNVTVNGIIMAGDDASAIVDWRSAPNGQKRNRILTVGDMIGDYTVSEIALGYVIFDSGGERFQVEKSRGQGGATGGSPVTRLTKPVEQSNAIPDPMVRTPKEPTLIESSKKLEAPEGYEYYMTPMGPTLRKKPAEGGTQSSGGKVHPRALFGH